MTTGWQDDTTPSEIRDEFAIAMTVLIHPPDYAELVTGNLFSAGYFCSKRDAT